MKYNSKKEIASESNVFLKPKIGALLIEIEVVKPEVLLVSKFHFAFFSANLQTLSQTFKFKDKNLSV